MNDNVKICQAYFMFSRCWFIYEFSGTSLKKESDVREEGKCFIFMLQTCPDFSSVFSKME